MRSIKYTFLVAAFSILALSAFAQESVKVNPATGAVSTPSNFRSANGLFISSVTSKSASYALSASGTNGGLDAVTCGSSVITATLPSASSAGNGWYHLFVKVDNGSGRIGTSPATLAAIHQNQVVMVWSDGTNYHSTIQQNSDLTNGGTLNSAIINGATLNDCNVPGGHVLNFAGGASQIFDDGFGNMTLNPNSLTLNTSHTILGAPDLNGGAALDQWFKRQ